MCEGLPFTWATCRAVKLFRTQTWVKILTVRIDLLMFLFFRMKKFHFVGSNSGFVRAPNTQFVFFILWWVDIGRTDLPVWSSWPRDGGSVQRPSTSEVPFPGSQPLRDESGPEEDKQHSGMSMRQWQRRQCLAREQPQQFKQQLKTGLD